MEDLITALGNLQIANPFNQMIEGLYAADLAKVLETIKSLTQMMDPSKQSNPRDTRDEMIKCYCQVMSGNHKLFIDPSNCNYIFEYECQEPTRIFQQVFFEQMASLACGYTDFRTDEMYPILRDALALNHPEYMMRNEHRQLAIAAAYFILWISFKSVEQQQLSSMFTDNIQDQIVRTLINCTEDRSGYYPEHIAELINSLREDYTAMQGEDDSYDNGEYGDQDSPM